MTNSSFRTRKLQTNIKKKRSKLLLQNQISWVAIYTIKCHKCQTRKRSLEKLEDLPAKGDHILHWKQDYCMRLARYEHGRFAQEFVT